MNIFFTKKRIVIFFLYILLAVIIFCFLDIYFFGYQTNLSKFTAKIIPYPAIIVNNDLITINQYENFSKSYESYLTESNITKNGFDRKMALKNIVQNIALEQILLKLDININDQEFNNYLDDFYKNNSSLKVSRENFNNYFLKPIFYRQKILEKITSDNFNLENKKKIEIIYGDLIKNPDIFSDYSKQYQDSSLGINSNPIGWLAYSDLPESLKTKVDKMQVGDFTPVIKSISGYHIYKLNGKIESDAGDNYYYQFNQIFLPIENFDNYLDNFLQKSKIFYFLKTTK